MDGEAILTVSAAVVTLTQLAKWGGLPDKVGPIAVLALSAIGVAVWGFSQQIIDRADTFEYFAGWVSVALSAAGTFGFTRAATSAVTAAKAPPAAGAAQSPTEKPADHTPAPEPLPFRAAPPTAAPASPRPAGMTPEQIREWVEAGWEVEVDGAILRRPTPRPAGRLQGV